MPLIYCDHNYVVTALQELQTYHAHLRHLIAADTLTLTPSPMHWVEAAEDTNLARGDAKAAWILCIPNGFLTDEAFNVSGRGVFNHLGVATNAPQMMNVDLLQADLPESF